ncbi:Nucleoside 5-triphosphatase RdgB (dHAPTP, dITP, XTP-specific) [Liberibacter crescens BT-1]|uniref:dITP/XTP pyrophosphatase n=1 Tax=Liberibacter crescens (strain BT-1) TaxID=1215343 RepID=L0EW51_LIBCB|nr:RdgB/HAM1 family non-canonical purine NTP pyrophosphatase [Liberibacter crescens]AGA65187.1 Nucleoside 5-triphosphatase RdgB (dHAPTP, dITP, XTP-specific) [Liberibacter crescens BT-1]AMC13143.1 purine NTP phosphatase [Liberibacter crescens]
MRKLDGKAIIVASHNKDKINEIYNLLSPLGFLIKSSAELNLIIPEETGTTFEENSVIKALSAAKALKIPALSDDSGLVVDALDGNPGVYSARWAETLNGIRNFSMAMEKIERDLFHKGANDFYSRSAQFVSVLCIAWPDGHVEIFSGIVKGTIVWPPRGENGFGYDPIFQPKGHSRTFGEMTLEEKNAFIVGQREEPLSHRARAFKLFIENCL